MKAYIFFVLLFCLALNCAGQNQGEIKMVHAKTSVFDTVSFDYITPAEPSKDASQQNKVFIIKTSATEGTKEAPVNTSAPDNSSQSVPTNVPKLSSGVEEKKATPK